MIERLSSHVLSLFMGLLLSAAALTAQDEPVRTLTQEYPVGGHQAVQSRLRIGELTVIGEDRETVGVTSRIFCTKADRSKCESASAGVGLSLTTVDGWMQFGLEGITEAALRKMRVRHEVRMPKGMPLEVDVVFGDAVIRGVEAGVNVNVGTGDAELFLPASSFRFVNLDAGGNVELRVGGQTIEGKGLLHESLDWRQEAGSSTVEVDVVLGDALVILQ